jgi:hypothetical protein
LSHSGQRAEGGVPWTRAILFSAAGAALLFALLAFEAGRYPGLQADEAWSGLAALSIQQHGLTTPHGMTDYTSPVFPWLLARSFDITRPGIGTMRVTTAVLAASGLFFVLFGLLRTADLRAGALFLALFASCLLWTWYGRVAFEVIGLQDLLLGVVVATTLGFAATGRLPFLAVAACLYATAIGIVSHLIFLIVPASLATAVLLLGLARGTDTRSDRLVVFAFFNLAMSAVLVAGKFAVGQEVFVAQRRLVLAALFCLPGAIALLHSVTAPGLERAAARVTSRLSERLPVIVAAWVLVGAGLVYALAHHGVALVQVYSSVPILQRFASLTPSAAIRLPLYAWGGVLSVLTLWTAFQVGTPARVRAGRPFAAFLALWFVAALVWLAIATTGNSIRYYRIPVLFAFLAISAGFGVRSGRATVRLAALAMVPAVVLNAFAFGETSRGSTRPPIDFRIGSMVESSAHFISLDEFVEAMRREGVCEFHANYFIAEPMRLHLALEGWECDPGRTTDVDYCFDCTEPPFVRWNTRLE